MLSDLIINYCENSKEITIQIKKLLNETKSEIKHQKLIFEYFDMLDDRLNDIIDYSKSLIEIDANSREDWEISLKEKINEIETLKKQVKILRI